MASFPNLIPPDARPPKGKIDRSFPSLRFTLKQQGFSFWCLCQCLRSQSLDLALRSLSFPRHWKSKATKKFLNKPSQLEPHLVFSLMPPRGRRFPPPHSSRALRGLGSRFLKGASCCFPPPQRFHLYSFTPDSLVPGRTPRELGRCRETCPAVSYRADTEGGRKTHTASVAVFSVSWEFEAGHLGSGFSQVCANH